MTGAIINDWVSDFQLQNWKAPLYRNCFTTMYPINRDQSLQWTERYHHPAKWCSSKPANPAGIPVGQISTITQIIVKIWTICEKMIQYLIIAPKTTGSRLRRTEKFKELFLMPLISGLKIIPNYHWDFQCQGNCHLKQKKVYRSGNMGWKNRSEAQTKCLAMKNSQKKTDQIRPSLEVNWDHH